MTAFSMTARVYWEDTDAGGIVYYANYLRFFERARTEWLRRCGVNQSEYQATGQGMFVVHQANLTYHAPARLDDLLLITVHIETMGGASFEMSQEAWRLDTNTQTPSQRLVSASIKAAWVNPANLKPAKIPPSLRTTLLSQR